MLLEFSFEVNIIIVMFSEFYIQWMINLFYLLLLHFYSLTLWMPDIGPFVPNHVVLMIVSF